MSWLAPSDKSGYTLIEMLVVLGLVILIVAVGVPKYTTTAQSLRVRNATYLLAGDLRLAQEKARGEMKYVRLQLLPSDEAPNEYTGYVIQVKRQGEGACSSTATAADIRTDDEYQLIKDSEHELPKKVILIDPSLSCFLFEPSGRPAWNERVDGINDTSIGLAGAPFNGVDWDPTCGSFNFDPEVATFSSSGTAVDVVVDLGEPRLVDSVSFEVLTDEISYFKPTLLNYRFSETAGWQSAELGSPTEADPSSCFNARYLAVAANTDPETKGKPVRYLYLHMEGTDLALGEIKLPLPGITVKADGGEASRRVEVRPITGHVQVN